MATERPGGGGGLPRAGLRVLLPGAAQWAWGQRERGAVLFGAFAAGVTTSAFTWGTAVGLALIGFAFATHVASAVDVIRQSAFPAPGRWPALAGAAGGLGAGVYAPVLTAATLLAWPGARDGGADGYLVNYWAYRRAEPRRDDLVWYRPAPWAAPRVGRVVAGGGQEVEWSENGLRVDGRPDRPAPWPPAPTTPRALTYRVPEGHVLVRPEDRAAVRASAADGLTIVAHDQVLGRAWARFYPIRDRRLL